MTAIRETFNRFRGHWFDASFLDEEFEGTPAWDNPGGVRSRAVDWHAFLLGIRLPDELCDGIALEMERTDPPLMSALPQLLRSVVESVRRSSKAPGFREIAEQLTRLRDSARRLAEVAQGGGGRGTPSATPEWWEHDENDVYSKHIELGLRQQDGRSPFLHPSLQDHLTMAMAPEDYARIQPNEPESDEKLNVARHSLTHFFKHLHLLLPVIEKAERMTRQLEAGVADQRTPGHQEDEARNWALIRLMWVWRDVLDGDATIYLRKIRDKVELDEPERQGCMAFIVAMLAHVDPVAPGEYEALERHLQTLKVYVPEASLLRTHS